MRSIYSADTWSLRGPRKGRQESTRPASNSSQCVAYPGHDLDLPRCRHVSAPGCATL
ncbi:hypothetical protein HanXRQr2_Chr13g0607941 [Helianthus annuus]|uniref:Uncharacterized protein n=1 Tax=Helianthus annuus TaxID=4232 RepID=A0A9K3ELR8_HELAN|nr:hypothetical protein HanXRQr2_Chr13g0607941 [Helianthus annuus]KAJ0850897.1 hypothetical protein HanPSC8_Chr13g0586171 [Helianthus annuus]